MLIVNEMHSVLSNTFRLYALAMGLWGLFAYLRNQAPSSSYWGAMVIGEIVVVLAALHHSLLHYLLVE